MTPRRGGRRPDDYDPEFTDALLFGVKVCGACGRERPDCRTYFVAGKNLCKDCRNAQEKARHAADPAGYALVLERKRDSERQREYHRRHREKHGEELRARDRERKAAEYAAKRAAS